jgi:hypothetical protein
MNADAPLAEPAELDCAKPFAVVCRRFDGSERQYQTYETAALAQLVARRLREIGLEARAVRATKNV